MADDLTADERQVLNTFRTFKTQPNDFLPSASVETEFYRYNKTATAAKALDTAYEGLIQKGYLTYNAAGGLNAYYLTQSGYGKANS